MLPLAVVAWGAFIVLMLRFGVLAAITAVWTANMLLGPALVYAPGSWTGIERLRGAPADARGRRARLPQRAPGTRALRRYLAGEPSAPAARDGLVQAAESGLPGTALFAAASYAR